MPCACGGAKRIDLKAFLPQNNPTLIGQKPMGSQAGVRQLPITAGHKPALRPTLVNKPTAVTAQKTFTPKLTTSTKPTIVNQKPTLSQPKPSVPQPKPFGQTKVSVSQTKFGGPVPLPKQNPTKIVEKPSNFQPKLKLPASNAPQKSVVSKKAEAPAPAPKVPLPRQKVFNKNSGPVTPLQTAQQMHKKFTAPTLKK